MPQGLFVPAGQQTKHRGPKRIPVTMLPPEFHALAHHPVYRAVDDLPRLRTFMRSHVFAVWDFMSLVKRLQREFTCTALPWRPPADATLARFVNEVVRDEESDLDPDGRPASHLELYLRAMREVGADTAPFETFLERLAQGVAPAEALSCAPAAAAAFVRRTLRVATEGSTLEVVAWFLHGREAVIPEMFTRLLDALAAAPGGRLVPATPTLRHYLQRHVELDGGEHSVAGERMLAHVVAAELRAGRADARARVAAAAADAVAARIALWDGVLEELTALGTAGDAAAVGRAG